MKGPHALIAGAGIGGLCAALCLARAGWRVTVYDKAKVLEEVGAGLQLSPNASVVLGRLDVIQRLKPFSLSPRAIKIRRSRDGAVLAEMSLENAEQRWGAPYLVAHRGDLQRVLLEAIAGEGRISLHTGAAVVGFTSCVNRVEVVVEHGDYRVTTTGDCLIGADGSRSLIRERMVREREGPPGTAHAQIVHPTDRPIYSGRTAWRTLVDAGKVPDDLRKEETTLWLGRRAHLVHYPLRKGTIVNVVAIVDEDFRVADEAEFWSSIGAPKDLEARFADWRASAKDLLRAAPQWRKWPLFDRKPIASWTAGRVALLGDAAHPMLPFLAQGAAQAIEDASALGEALAGHLNVEEGLLTYQAARHARATRVQWESRRQAQIYHFGGPAALVRDFALRGLGGEKMLSRYDWLYDAHTPRA